MSRAVVALKDVVAVTTIRQSNPLDPIERVRSEVFLDTAKALAARRISCIAIYMECKDVYLEIAREIGVIMLPQQSNGMGNVRREALRAGLCLFPQASYYFWLEPEKSQIPLFVEPLIRLMQGNNAVMGVFNRNSMSSYPEEQAYFYLTWRTVTSKLIGFDIDYAFGPLVLTKESLPYFLEYNGEYGDKWDALLIPRLRVIKSRASVVVLPIDFKNDPRMTQIESGNITMILKRIEQMNNIVPSLIQEWQVDSI